MLGVGAPDATLVPVPALNLVWSLIKYEREYKRERDVVTFWRSKREKDYKSCEYLAFIPNE